MATLFESIVSFVTAVPSFVPDIILNAVGIIFLLGWGYSIIHFLTNEMPVKQKVLWGIIVFVVPFGFMFYLTSHIEWEESGYTL